MHTLGIKFSIKINNKRFKRLKNIIRVHLQENNIFAVSLRLFVKFTSYSWLKIVQSKSNFSPVQMI